MSSVWRFTTAPWRLGVGVSRSAIGSGERAGRALARSGERTLLQLLDRLLSTLIDEGVLDRVLVRIEEAGVVEHTAQHVLESGVVEQLTERLLSGPELRRMVRSAFRSELPDELVAQLLASEAVWVLVDELVSSPTVTEAITHQGAGFVEQVGATTRDRSREADARLQRLAERLVRRHRPSAPAREPGGAPISGHVGGEGARWVP